MSRWDQTNRRERLGLVWRNKMPAGTEGKNLVWFEEIERKLN
jgi:hypothetical protein